MLGGRVVGRWAAALRAAPAAACGEETESATHVYGHGRPERLASRSRANSINAKARSVASWLLVCLRVA